MRNPFRFPIAKDDYKLVAGILAGVAILLTVTWYDELHWQKFLTVNSCTMVEQRASQHRPIFGADGKFLMEYIPAQKAYKCADGITYWR